MSNLVNDGHHVDLADVVPGVLGLDRADVERPRRSVVARDFEARNQRHYVRSDGEKQAPIDVGPRHLLNH